MTGVTGRDGGGWCCGGYWYRRLELAYGCGDQILSQVQQNTAQRQQLEAAYQQTNGAIAALYEFAPPEEGEDADNAKPERSGGRGRAGRSLNTISFVCRYCSRR